MIGIYKITNKINNHCYIGQSRNIAERWENHIYNSQDEKNKSYNYPLYQSFRKYGVSNFTFEVLEECKIDNLNNRETYWIDYYKPEYNQTIGGDYRVIYQKLNYQEVQDIQNILINDKLGIVNHSELAKKYKVSKDTIRDINVGRTWFNEKLSYPLHYSRFDKNKPKEEKKLLKKVCPICGGEWSGKGQKCQKCSAKEHRKIERPSRDELKKLIRNKSFTSIANTYYVSDNSIRKWCISYNLPNTKKIINSYTDDEWKNI